MHCTKTVKLIFQKSEDDKIKFFGLCWEKKNGGQRKEKIY